LSELAFRVGVREEGVGRWCKTQDPTLKTFTVRVHEREQRLLPLEEKPQFVSFDANSF